ncbi:hypothetical protein JCM5353_003228 [Sporobolomyces roseus]
MTTEAEKREKQSKALGAAFLAHQVQQLESRVDTLSFARDHSSRAAGGGRGRGRGGRGQQSGAYNKDQPPRKDKQIRVVDASVLVHSLPLLKKWVREDRYQFIVPLSALSTLDILKKSPQPLHDLAREATRFLETQFNIARQISSSSSSPVEATSRIRLRAQASHEEQPWSQVEQLFTVPNEFKVELPMDENRGAPVELPLQEDGEPIPIPLPTASDIPRSLRSTLQCTLYFSRLSPETSVLLYNSSLPVSPPIPSSLLQLISTQLRTPHPPQPPLIDFLSLSSGDPIDYYLKTFFPTSGTRMRVVQEEEVVQAKEWWKLQVAAKSAKERERLNGNGENNRGGGGGARMSGRSGNGKGRSTSGENQGGGGTTSQSTKPTRTLFVA